MNSTSLAIHSSTYGLLLGTPENWGESKSAPPNINIFILLSSLTAPGRPSHAYSINKRHAQCTQVSVSIHTHPQIPWRKLFVLTRACKRDREKTNTDKDGECRKKCFERKKWVAKNKQTTTKIPFFAKAQERARTHTHTHTHTSRLSIFMSSGFEKRYFNYSSSSLAPSLSWGFQRQANTVLLFIFSAYCLPRLFWLNRHVMQTQDDAEPRQMKRKHIHC